MRAWSRPLVAAGLLLLAGSALLAAASTGERTRALPDLRQLLPGQLDVVEARGRERLVFSSTIVNLGPGPFVIEGRRASRAEPLMTAGQALLAPDGGVERVHDVGRLRYVRSSDHAHWHLLRLEIYELRHPRTGALVAPDRKTGFCPGDRYPFRKGQAPGWNRRLGGQRNDNECGKGRVRALRMLESISPGWADIYHPELEGQFIDVTGVPAGEYVLVNRVNPWRRMREARYDNNASSMRIKLSRPAGRPTTVTRLRSCPIQARCP